MTFTEFIDNLTIKLNNIADRLLFVRDRSQEAKELLEDCRNYLGPSSQIEANNLVVRIEEHLKKYKK